MITCGIDPGMTGGIAFIDDDGLTVYKMPVYEITKGKSKRKRIDIHKLNEIMRYHAPDHVTIEQVSAQPGNGSAAAFTYGFGCGVIEAVVQCGGHPFTYVTPQRWKKAMQCPKDKDGARMRASQLFPDHADKWTRKNQDGLAEAALIALCAAHNL